MTRENLLKIKTLWPNINAIDISVDAATEETYKIVRKGGNFKRLWNNLRDLDDIVMAKQGLLDQADQCYWQVNIVVQAANYRELAEFVGQHLAWPSRPRIWTNLISRWGHMTTEMFQGMAVWQQNHPDRAQLIDILKDPMFNDPRINLGNLNSLRAGK